MGCGFGRGDPRRLELKRYRDGKNKVPRLHDQFMGQVHEAIGEVKRKHAPNIARVGHRFGIPLPESVKNLGRRGGVQVRGTREGQEQQINDSSNQGV